MSSRREDWPLASADEWTMHVLMELTHLSDGVLYVSLHRHDALDLLFIVPSSAPRRPEPSATAPRTGPLTVEGKEGTVRGARVAPRRLALTLLTSGPTAGRHRGATRS